MSTEKDHSPCIGKNCKQKAGCLRHRLMEIAVDAVLADVKEQLTNGDVDINEFCKMWKNMRNPVTGASNPEREDAVDLPRYTTDSCDSTALVYPNVVGAFTASC